MTGHRPFADLTKGFSPERKARIAAKAAALREEMTLEELRKARSLSQEEVAAALAVGQPAVAKMEKRTDIHVSNLRRYVEALGGTLEITARFPNASVVITSVGDQRESYEIRPGLELEKGRARRRSRAAGPDFWRLFDRQDLQFRWLARALWSSPPSQP